jgi:uncharacterized protein (TIGR03000 family)
MSCRSFLAVAAVVAALLAVPAQAADYATYPVYSGYYPGYTGDNFYSGYWGSQHGWTNYPFGLNDYGLNYHFTAPTTIRYAAYEAPQGFPSPPPVPDTVSASTSGAPEDNAAHLQVRVPAGADLWFEGVRMPQTGEMREFTSPELTPGKGYVYDVRARWTEDGRVVDRTRTVRVRANKWTEVDMTQPEPGDRKGR